MDNKLIRFVSFEPVDIGMVEFLRIPSTPPLDSDFLRLFSEACSLLTLFDGVIVVKGRWSCASNGNGIELGCNDVDDEEDEVSSCGVT